MMSHGREHGKIVSSDCYNIDIEQDILRRFNNEYCPQLQARLSSMMKNSDHLTDQLFRAHQSSSSCKPAEEMTEITGL